MCLDSTVVLPTGELLVEGGSSEFDGPQFQVLGCRESAIHQGRHGVAQRRFDLAGSVLVQLGGLFGDDCLSKSRCGRHVRHRDGSGRRRVPCRWGI